MISYLKGKIVLKEESFLILDVKGVGYEINIPKGTSENLPSKNGEVELFCYLDVGERNLTLYGFTGYEQLKLFRLVKSVKDVGPRIALQICSIGSPQEVLEKIKEGEAEVFEKVSGIGKKKGQRIVLEISGKVQSSGREGKQESSKDKEVIEALVNMGFPRSDAREVASKTSQEEETSERIKKALKILGNENSN